MAAGGHVQALLEGLAMALGIQAHEVASTGVENNQDQSAVMPAYLGRECIEECHPGMTQALQERLQTHPVKVLFTGLAGLRAAILRSY